MHTRRQAIQTFLFAGASAAPLLAAPAKPNFSGRWTLDRAASSPGSPALIENIDHREPQIRIDTDWDRNGPTGLTNAAMLAPTIELLTGGEQSANEMPAGLSLQTKSHWEGDKLMTAWTIRGLDAPLTGSWTRYLTGPNTMAVDAISEARNHRVTSRLVFVK